MRESQKLSQIFAVALALLCATLAPLTAVEIPIDDLGQVTKVAYVDMHKIFEVFPETERARTDLTRLIEEKQSEITLKKEEVARLKGEVEFLAIKLKTARQAATAVEISTLAIQPKLEGISISSATPSSVQISTWTVPTLPAPMGAAVDLLVAQLKEKETLLKEKQVDLEAFVGGTQEEIVKLQDGRNMDLLARIYKVLQEVATRSGYTMVFDRDNVLYAQATVDITDTVLKRLRER